MGHRRVLQGVVVSDKMEKTVVVSVERRKEHRLYHKVLTLSERFMAHDERNECNLGDVVRLEEYRPTSRHKRWRVIEVLSRGDVAEIAPETIGRALEEETQISAKAEAEAASTEATSGEAGEAPAEDAGDDEEEAEE